MRFLFGIYLALVLAVFSSCRNKPEDLMTASANGDLGRVQQLLRDGAKVNQRDRNGKTAIHYAAQSKNVVVVQTLIQAGADVNATSAGNVTPLMLSVDMAFGQPDISLALIKAGADVNAADEDGNTALIIAATESSDEVFQTLLEKGANVNARGLNGGTALHYAAMNAFSDRARLLLAHGADVTI